MKRLFLITIVIFLLLTGCSNDDKREITIHKPSNVEVEMISVDEKPNSSVAKTRIRPSVKILKLVIEKNG